MWLKRLLGIFLRGQSTPKTLLLIAIAWERECLSLVCLQFLSNSIIRILNIISQIMESDLSRDSCCEICLLKFDNGTVLSMHKRIVHRIQAKPIKSEKNKHGVQQGLLRGERTIFLREKSYCWKSSLSIAVFPRKPKNIFGIKDRSFREN